MIVQLWMWAIIAVVFWMLRLGRRTMSDQTPTVERPCPFCGQSLNDPAPMLPFGNHYEGEATCLLYRSHQKNEPLYRKVHRTKAKAYPKPHPDAEWIDGYWLVPVYPKEEG